MNSLTTPLINLNLFKNISKIDMKEKSLIGLIGTLWILFLIKSIPFPKAHI